MRIKGALRILKGKSDIQLLHPKAAKRRIIIQKAGRLPMPDPSKMIEFDQVTDLTVNDDGTAVSFSLVKSERDQRPIFKCSSETLGVMIQNLQALAAHSFDARTVAGLTPAIQSQMVEPTVEVTSFRFAAANNGKSLRLQVSDKHGRVADIEFPRKIALELPETATRNVEQMKANDENYRH